MKTFLFKLFYVATILLMLVTALPMQPAQAAGSISLTTLGSPYSQNFDSLASSGTSSAVPTGWEFAESGTNANTVYTAGTGSSNTGDTYSFGPSGSSERAFGGILSGSIVSTVGAQFNNDTGAAITALNISYTGEQWRLGATGRTDRLDFQYSIDASSLTSGTWIDVDELDFNGPISTGTAGALDGNAAANRVNISHTIPGLNIPDGAAFWIRWLDFNASGADDGLAVDDFSLTPQGDSEPPAPSAPKINEFSASTVGTDVEYVEFYGDPNTDYSAYTLLEIEGDSGAAAGTVDEVINLGVTNANGLYLVNLAANALENGSLTLLLVKNFGGALNIDLDTDNDGVFDITPWDDIVDSVAVDDGGAGDVTYGPVTLGVAYDGLPFAPGGASRIPDGADTDTVADWVRNDFDLAGIPGFDGTPEFGEAYNTPGTLNQVVVPPAPQLVINEVDYDQPGTDTAEFIEIKNNGFFAVSLDGWTLELVNGNGGGAAIYNTITLPNVSLPAGGYFVVCANAATVANCELDASPNTDFIQNGAPDAVGLRFNGVLMDAVSYEGDSGAPYTEGTGIGLEDPGTTGSDTLGISRCPDGADTNVNNVDFTLMGITPGAANSCASATPQLSVDDVSQNEGNIGATTFMFTVSLSVPAPAGGVTFDIATADNTATVADNDYVVQSLTGQAIPSGSSTYTFSVLVNGDTTDEPDETFLVNITNVTSATVVDGQGVGTILNDDSNACGLAYTPIYAIQGSGMTAAITGTVTTQGVVVGDNEGASPALRGFYLQDLTGDGDPATSDGIFVFNGNNDTVSLGDIVRVTGAAAEFQDQTQVSASSIIKCGTGIVAPVEITFPVPSADYLERYEGMLVRLPQTMYVTEHFQLGRFGQVVLSANARLQQPTNVVLPGAPALALQTANDLNKIILDDNLQNQNPDPILFGRGGQPLSASNTLRGGDTIAGLVGVLTYTWSGNSASGNAYRIRPIGALGGNAPDFQPANPRPDSAPDVGGALKVVGLNLLNYFNTFSGCTLGVGGAATDCRGAENLAEFNRQWAKTVAAILAMNPDVIGVNEIENDGYGPTSAIADLVDRLNAATAPGTYAYINVDAATGQVNALGTDAIKVGLVYKPGTVTPAGQTAALNSAGFVNGSDSAPRNRASLAQAFQQNSNGAVFLVNINHLKSKGSACNLPDQGDGQGNCNQVRLNAVNELMAWLASDPTGTGDPDILLIGDYNSYAMEDPILALENGGFTHLIKTFLGPDAYSYVFDGQWGYLDHALASTSLAAQVTGVADYHINADEPSVLDYNTNFKSPAQIASLYAPDEFRVSDHDPVIIGLNLNAAPSVDAGGPYTVDEGDSVTLTALAADPDGDTLTYAWDLDNNGTFETSGQSASFAGVDGPANYTVNVQVTDSGGLSATATTVITVNNLAPVIGNIVAPASPVKTGATVKTSANFTDTGILDTHTALWNWGDGSTSSGVVTEANGSGSVKGSHAYTKAGLYIVTLTVTDKDGGAGQATFETVIVYNPGGGFATGGGWFNSPAGAYLEKPTLKGLAITAFTVKYLRSSSSTPSGSFEFLFLAGNLQFRATSFDWLVVDQTSKTAQFQGTGKINGKGNYKFMAWVDDGRPDKIRIKIWKADGTVIYDTASKLPLLSGSIIIHR